MPETDDPTIIIPKAQVDALENRLNEPARHNPRLREQMAKARNGKWAHLISTQS